MAAQELGLLLCGAVNCDVPERCEIRDVLVYLRGAIETTVSDLPWVFQQDDARVSRYAPFLARTLLELGATALLSRLDPTRILFVKRTQELPAYAPDRVWKTAIRWQGDVVADRVPTLWSEAATPKDMTRALVGDYYANLYWRTAHERLADTDIEGSGAWLAVVKGLTFEQFLGTRRNLLSAMFSTSSKAIHHEYVIPVAGMFDRATCLQLVTDATRTLSELGALLNLLPHTPYRADVQLAFGAVLAVEQFEVSQ